MASKNTAIVNSLEGIQEDFGDLVSSLDAKQKELLAYLAGVHRSLLRPEGLLDKGNYSRSFAPPNNITAASSTEP